MFGREYSANESGKKQATIEHLDGYVGDYAIPDLDTQTTNVDAKKYLAFDG